MIMHHSNCLFARYPLLLLLLLLLSAILATCVSWPCANALSTAIDATHLVVLKGKPEMQTLRAITNHTVLLPGEISAQGMSPPSRIISIGGLNVVLSRLADSGAPTVADIVGVRYVNPNHRVHAFGSIEYSSAISDVGNKRMRRATPPIPIDDRVSNNSNSNNGTGVSVYVLDT